MVSVVWCSGWGWRGEGSDSAALGVSRVASSARSRLSVVGPDAANLGADAVALAHRVSLHVLRAALPLPSHRQRLAAAGFAIEDLIAEPLEDTHVALGPEVAPGEYLVVAVSHRDMEGLGGPDAPRMSARLPARRAGAADPGQGLLLGARGGWPCTGAPRRRHRLRHPRLGCFEAFWRADGAPQVVLYGGDLPDTIPVGVPGLLPLPVPRRARPGSSTCLRASHARRQQRPPRAWGIRLAAVVLVALAAHVAILRRRHGRARAHGRRPRGRALRSAIAARVPALPAGLPIEVALQRAPCRSARGGGCRRLPAAPGRGISGCSQPMSETA